MSEDKEAAIKVPEPLDEREREALSKVSKRIQEAAEENDVETVNRLRRQLIDAANLGILGKEDNSRRRPSPNV